MLDAQGELLHVRRVGMIVDDVYADSEGTGTTPKRIGQIDDLAGRRVGCVHSPRNGRAVKSFERQYSTIEYLLQFRWLQYDPVIIDAVPTAHHRHSFSER